MTLKTRASLSQRDHSHDSLADQLSHAERHLVQGHFHDAVMDCSRVMEAVLQEVLGRYLATLSAEQKAAFQRRRPKDLKKKLPSEYSLGQLVYSLEEEREHFLSQVKGRDLDGLRKLNWTDLKECSDRRGPGAHNKVRSSTVADANFMLGAARTLMSRFGAVSTLPGPAFPREPTLKDRFGSLKDAVVSAMQECAAAPPVTVRLLGFSLGSAWPSIRDDIAPLYAEANEGAPVNLELAMLDPRVAATYPIPDDWKVECRTRLEGFPASIAELVRRNPFLSVKLWLYQGFPAVHGVSIGHRYVAAAMSRWDRDAPGASAPYLLTHRSDPVLGRFLLEFFEDNFSRLTSHSPVGTWTSGSKTRKGRILSRKSTAARRGE